MPMPQVQFLQCRVLNTEIVYPGLQLPKAHLPVPSAYMPDKAGAIMARKIAVVTWVCSLRLLRLGTRLFTGLLVSDVSRVSVLNVVPVLGEPFMAQAAGILSSQ